VSRVISSRPRIARSRWPLVGCSTSANRGGEELSDIAISPSFQCIPRERPGARGRPLAHAAWARSQSAGLPKTMLS
jgi:hypothetical protein